MSKEEMNRVKEGLIAIMLFDGWKKTTRHTFDPTHNGGKNDYVVYAKIVDGIEIGCVREEDVEFDIVYNKSWNALMPVVEKIGKQMQLTQLSAIIDKLYLKFSKSEKLITNIDTLYLAVVDFITHHQTLK